MVERLHFGQCQPADGTIEVKNPMRNPRKDRVVVYVGKNGRWHWTYIRSNGRKMADCGFGYKRKYDCLKGVTRVTGGADIDIVVRA